MSETGSWRRRVPSRGWVQRFVAAVFLGLSVGALVSPDPMSVPGVDSVPGVAVAAVGGALGVLLYRYAPSADCGCGDDCSC